MIKIALVAACDRNNFGDVILPMICEEFLCNEDNSFEFEYFGLSESDLTSIGGKKTKSLFEIDESFDVIIVSGGEVMSARYVNMYLNLQNNTKIIRIYSILSRLWYQFADLLCKIKLNGKYFQPWIILPHSHQMVIYNSVGGANDLYNKRQRKEWVRCIRKSTCFSVRGMETFKYICDTLGERDNVKLIPDTAIVMSEIYGDSLHNLCTSKIKNLIDKQNKYVVVQVNKLYGMPKISELVSLIKLIYKNTGYKTILLPIGRAQGHDDELPLQQIYEKTKDNSIFITNNNIFDVMYIISKSKCFMGTSLHGMITAASFLVPHMSLNSNAVKLMDYLNTWNTTKYLCLESHEKFIDLTKNNKLIETVNEEEIANMKAKVIDMLKYEFKLIERLKNEKKKRFDNE